jgi:NAD(P)H-hydrate repair Nnr-like enzyme with NAD(P)H-hydrate dehydratase domain
VVAATDGPLVLDAMGLALLSRDPSALGAHAAQTVLTPNLAELGHLLSLERAEVEENPLAAAMEVAQRTKAVVSAGGAESWTVSPSGQVWRDRSGGSGLAVSGSGDVLAGIVVGLAARGATPEQAAVWGTHLHKRAGDRLAASVGPLGFLARELPPEVPRVLLEFAV